jgi:ankyrin repeat protein
VISLASGVHVMHTQYRDSPAIYAVRTGNDTDLKAAIAKGTDVNLRDKSGLTALLYATSLAGASQFVRQLLTAGADSNASTPTGQTIGMDLIIGGLQFRIVGGGTTSLMLAAMNVDSDAIASLVAAGANITAKNDKGETACQMIPGPQSQSDAVMEVVENEARRLRGLPPKPSVAPNSSRLAEARGLLCK